MVEKSMELEIGALNVDNDFRWCLQIRIQSSADGHLEGYFDNSSPGD